MAAAASTPSTVWEPYFPAPTLLALPWAIRNTWSAGCPASTMTSPGSYSCWTKRSASASRTVRPRTREQRQLGQFLRDDLDLVTDVGETQLAVADRIAQPAVDPVGAAVHLHPRQDLQQPP